MLGNKSHRHYAHLRCESHPSIHCVTLCCHTSLFFTIHPRDLSSHIFCVEYTWIRDKITENMIIFKAFIPLAFPVCSPPYIAYITHQQHHKSLSRTCSSNSSSIITFSLLSSSIILYAMETANKNPQPSA